MSKMHRNHGPKRTAGFSLVEMLVVMAIIAILVSLTAAAVFKVIGVQRANNTVLTVKSASSLLDKQWAAVIGQAKNEQIPSSVMTLAGNDPTRARVIWTKLRLRQEFPMNISEALYPYWAGTSNFLTASDLPANLQGKKYYYDRITKAFPQLLPILNPSPVNPNLNWPNLSAIYPSGSATGQTSPPFTNSSQQLWPLESSFCLTMALQVNRGSIVFIEESFAVNALSTEIYIPQGTGGRQLVFSGPKSLVDGWGFPLFFYRFPVGNLDFYPSATPAGNPVSATARNATFPDPLDPQGTLVDPRWNNGSANVQIFEQYCHPIHSPGAKTYTPFSPYSEPTIVSGGPDNTLGITASSNSPFSADIMSFDPLSATQAFDNVASYKLRLGGSGDK
jgi:prepilin-type N-terminal cleavage/methylation domain-containing protein